MSASTCKVRLVVFDLGRVLIRLWDGWDAACANAGIELPQKLTQLSAESKAAIEELSVRYDTGLIDVEAYAQALAPHRGLQPADVMKLVPLVLREPFEGVDALIDEIHAVGVKTACLSNTCEPHWSMMLTPGGQHSLPLHRLTHRFASHLIGLRKPDPRLYEHVEQVTAVPADQIVFFDDLAANVDAALQRGWRGFCIQSLDDPISEMRKHMLAQEVIDRAA